jgi:membrane fusion protein (multidrug efflux system)
MQRMLLGENMLKNYFDTELPYKTTGLLEMKNTRKKALCLALLMSLTACTKNQANSHSSSEKKGVDSGAGAEKGGGKAGRGRGRGPAVVQTVVAKKQRAAQQAQASVPLVGRKQTNVFSKVAGRVARRLVPEGQAVKAGQTLFQVDRSEPGESYLSVPVTSPISGWVGRWNVTEGTQVSTQDAVVLVVDDQTLIANIFLPVQEWVQVKLNSKVSIRVQEIERPARILTIARAAESGSGRGALTVELNNADYAFKSGVVALASLELDTRDRLLVPASALRISDQGAAVFKVEENKAKRVKVNYELFNNDTVEILSGLTENDTVVSVGAHQLFDGAEIKVADSVGAESQSSSPDGSARSRKRAQGEGEGK